MYDILFPSLINTWLRDPHVAVTYPGVKRVLFNKNITKVEFSDGTWSLVRLSENDIPNRETAVLYALVKRIYGKISHARKNYGEAVESAVGAKIRKLVDTAVDLDKKATAKAKAKSSRGISHTKVYVKSPCSCSSCSKYVRPNKPFAEFTTAEKRAYWRAQKRGLLSK